MHTDIKALIAVILGNTIFGFSFLFSKLALEVTIPSVLIAVRFTVAFIVLNLCVLFGQKVKKADGRALFNFSLKDKPLKYILLLALFQPIIYFVAENYGIVYTSSAFAGIIIAIIPIAGIILDVIIMGTKVSLKQVLCAVVFSKKSAPFYSPLERTYIMFGMGSALPIFWGCILYLSVVSSVIAFLLLNYGSNYVSVSSATIFANFTTIISIVAGVLILGESFSVYQLVGAAIILISVYFSQQVL